MEVQLTSVFRRTGEALIAALNDTGPRLIINCGGQGSSKTFSTLQVIYNLLTGSQEPLRVTFCSYALPHLKQGVIADFDKILASFGENIGEVKSQPAQPIYRIGKSEINCYGVEGNIAMAHGPRRDILFINEVNRKITYEVFDQLFTRSRVTIIDFNPDRDFWLQERVMPIIPHTEIRSNFMDNPYLPEAERRNILMKKDKPAFENWWRVYGLGLDGKLEGAIFSNWSFGEFDESLPYSFGLDFGFNDPDALVKCAIDDKRKIIYASEKMYKTGNSASQLKLLLNLYCSPDDLIVADCADARMIDTLKSSFNVEAVNKARWTVAEAIKMMQGYEIIITEDSTNLTKEISGYVWQDKRGAVPMQGADHLIDALRYAFMKHISGSRKPSVVGFRSIG